MRRSRCALGLLLVVATAAVCAASQPLPLRVSDGRCEAVLPSEHADTQYFLILSALDQTASAWPVRIHTEPTTLPQRLPRPDETLDSLWQERVAEVQQRQEQARQRGSSIETFPALPTPPQSKVFYLFTQERDLHHPQHYTAVQANLASVGAHCQVYLDRDYRGPDLQNTLAEIVQVFERAVWPHARQKLGGCSDVDRDGRFTILLTPWLTRLQGGKLAVSGFVRGSDFYRELPNPFSNQCDMMYLSTALRPGPHLRSVLAHEYTHAILFSEHVFGSYLPGTRRQDEDGWLNEAICHVVEDTHAFGWTNLDYRISAFLSQPRCYPLVLSDAQTMSQGRTAGIRGAAYLFLRWCVDTYGPEVTARLIRSNVQGVANLEAATQRPFAELFRAWSVALLLSERRLPCGGYAPLRRLSLYAPLASRLLLGPRIEEMPLRGERALTLASTSTAHLLLHTPDGARTRLVIDADPRAELQVTLVPLPRNLGRLTVTAQRCAAGRSFQLEAQAHGQPLQLQAAVWENALPSTEDPDDSSYHEGRASDETVKAWFPQCALAVGGRCRSVPIAMPARPPGRGPLVVKVLAVNSDGQRVTAWAQIGED